MVLGKSRRSFIEDLGVGAVGYLSFKTLSRVGFCQDQDGLHLACSEYPWLVFYRREKRDFKQMLNHGLGEAAAAGFDGYEPLVEKVSELDQLAPLLKKHSLEMRSARGFSKSFPKRQL